MSFNLTSLAAADPFALLGMSVTQQAATSTSTGGGATGGGNPANQAGAAGAAGAAAGGGGGGAPGGAPGGGGGGAPGGGGGAGAGAANQGGAGNPVPFALTPSLIAPNDILDYRDKGVQRMFYQVTEAWNPEDRFDLSPAELYGFMKGIEHRAIEAGWWMDQPGSGILWVPTDPGPNNDFTPAQGQVQVYKSLIHDYGQVSYPVLHMWERTYVEQPIRRAQDAMLLHRFLMNSLSNAGKRKIEVFSNQYTINGRLSGNLLLKIIVRESQVDTNATTATLRIKLSNFDEYLAKVGWDITRGNAYILYLEDTLKARGETTDRVTMLISLFKGYEAVPDKEFTTYIAIKKIAFDEGQDLTPSRLMELADNKYKTIKEAGRWQAPTPEEEKINALQAELDKAKSAMKKGGKSGKKGGKDNKKVSFNKSGKKAEGKKDDFPAWMYVEPKESELTKPREWNGREWYWCSHKTGGHCKGQYRRHKPETCDPSKAEKAKKRGPSTKVEGKTGGGASRNPKKQRQMVLDDTMAKMSLVEKDDNSDSDDSVTFE